MDRSELEAEYVSVSELLAAAVDTSLEGWVESSVRRIVESWAAAGRGVTAGVDAAALALAARQCRVVVGSRVRDLLDTPVAAQRSTPLAELRAAVAFPTAVLRSAGVPPVVRDAVATERFPGDDYDLTPGSWTELSADLGDIGLRWAALKAALVLGERGATRPSGGQ